MKERSFLVYALRFKRKMLIYFLKLCCAPNTVILKTMLATLTLKENNMDLAFGENIWLSFGASFTHVSNWTRSAFLILFYWWILFSTMTCCCSYLHCKSFLVPSSNLSVSTAQWTISFHLETSTGTIMKGSGQVANRENCFQNSVWLVLCLVFAVGLHPERTKVQKCRAHFWGIFP